MESFLLPLAKCPALPARPAHVICPGAPVLREALAGGGVNDLVVSPAMGALVIAIALLAVRVGEIGASVLAGHYKKSLTFSLNITGVPSRNNTSG